MKSMAGMSSQAAGYQRSDLYQTRYWQYHTPKNQTQEYYSGFHHRLHGFAPTI
jgi:hypothetical protein